MLALLHVSTLCVRAEVAPCVYDKSECSCKLGDAKSGICLDLVSGTDGSGTCKTRYCKSGWTCSCHGRTNLCGMKEGKAHIRDTTGGRSTVRRAIGDIVPCHSEGKLSAGSGVRLKLGSFFPKYSRTGLLDGQCKQLAWWVDGELVEVYGKEEISEDNIDEEMFRRANNTLFPLKAGSVIAFRFKQASYHCFSSFASIVVNGTRLDTNNPTVKIRFNRAHVPNWFAPDANLTYAEDEHTAAVTEFIPLRSHMLFDGSAIAKGEDTWKPPDGTEDHKVSNFYFRIDM